jgi:hypothetical protein
MRGPESPATPTTEAGLLSFQLLPRSDSLPWAVLLFCGRLVSGNAADRSEHYWNLRLDLGWALASESAPFPLGVFHPALRLPSGFRISV